MFFLVSRCEFNLFFKSTKKFLYKICHSVESYARLYFTAAFNPRIKYFKSILYTINAEGYQSSGICVFLLLFFPIFSLLEGESIFRCWRSLVSFAIGGWKPPLHYFPTFQPFIQ